MKFLATNLKERAMITVFIQVRKTITMRNTRAHTKITKIQADNIMQGIGGEKNHNNQDHQSCI